ncbi:MAG: DUF5011 domain-containing protein [Tissierellaceae bacterium]|nr:DUF5011 domain-containing protein [Tissierellaceae bacterium]
MCPNCNNKKFKFIIPVVIILLGITIFIGVSSADKVNEIVTIEAGSNSLEIADFIIDEKDTGEFITDLSDIDLNIPGSYDIEVKVGRRKYQSTLEVIDTIAPTAEVVNHEVWTNEVKEPEDFVTNIVDATEVVVSFKQTPEFDLAGEHEVVLILEDTSGNKSELKASLTIIQDMEVPEIIGAENQTIFVGEKVSYRKGVEAIDNRDGKIDFEVDSSKVNLKQAGVYEVFYTANDQSGNTSIKVVTITVKEKPKDYVDEEELHRLADGILESLFTEGMTDKEKLWEIFQWTNKHITYTGNSDKSDWKQGAVRGIRKANGDCFTYYATARELLTRAGFENLEVQRVDGTHYWNLVLYEGNWYHFDTCPYRTGYPYQCFLKTDAEVEEYSNWCKDYFKFDKSLYPRTPLEPLE